MQIQKGGQGVKQTGAQIIIQALIDEGCDTVFGYPGGQVLPIYDALYQKRRSLRHILTAHEQGAAHAADGYARATGKTGVVIATSGPGATNLVTGIAAAYLDSSPLVAITGNVPTSCIGTDSFQEVDTVGITLPVTKHNFFVRDITRLRATVHEAFVIARSGRPGPVLIDVPSDIQAARITPPPLSDCPISEDPIAPQPLLEQAAQLLCNAKRPYLYCGGGVVSANAADALLNLAARLDAPIGCTLMGRSAVPSDSPYCLGLQGMFGKAAANLALHEADVILVAGARFSERTMSDHTAFPQRPKIIHIDIDAAELEKNVPIYLGIHGTIHDALRRLCDLLPQCSHTEWLRAVHRHAADDAPDAEVFAPPQILRTLAKFTAADTVIATDVGQHQMWTAQFYPFRQPRTLLTSGGLGAMGFGLGAAIGAAVGTDQRTVLITGDGSFLMNLSELSTAVNCSLPLVILLLRNDTLGMVHRWQERDYNARYYATALSPKTDFPAIARAFGAKGYRADSLSALEAALQAAFSDSGVTLIECPIAPQLHP